MQEYDLTISEKFAAAQRLVSAIYPSLTSFYIMCNKRIVPGITFRLNTRTGSSIILEYSMDFIDSISVNTLAILLSIEMFRLILHHPTSRLLYPVNICYKASNIICTDTDNILTLPIDPETKRMFPSSKELQQIDKTFDLTKDFYLERVFAVLNNAEKDSEEKKGDSAGNSSDASGEGTGDSGDTGNSSEKELSGADREREAIKRHFSQQNMEKSIENWGENEMLDTKIRNKVLKEMQNPGWGRMPGDMKERIRKLNEVVYDPRAIFAKFTRSVFSTVETFTRMKPPRRAGQNYIGIIAGKRHEQQAKVLIAFDSSGSMSDEDLEKGLGFMENCLRHAEVHYCWWDCNCTDFTKVRMPKPDYEVTGRGGTNPQCIIEKLKETKAKFDGIVVFTDCEFEWDRPNTKYDICIVRTDRSAEPPDWVKWSFKLKDLVRYC